jgi:dihydroorotate dehydrogenase (NAD+) catalytic subunit
VEFSSPIIGASGTFGYGLEYSPIFDLNKVGGISVKGLSLHPHDGNPMPRIRETTAGMLNAIGLQNVGVEAFLRDKLPFLRKYSCRIIANFWGKTLEEYVQTAEILDKSNLDMLEMNISCPNVKAGGILFTSHPDKTREVVKAVRKVVKNTPLIVKLSPNVTDIKAYAKVCEEEGADAIAAINTLVGMAINIKTRKPYLANVTGGLSGPAIKPVGIRAVSEIYRTVKIPIIGIGGITNHEDVVEYFLAGAQAVQVGTANFVNNSAIPEMTESLNKYCEENNINNISELTGGVIL